MDAEQEEYFNTSDEEDNVVPANSKEPIPVKPVNGTPSSLLKPLVDYPDDDAMDVAGDEVAKKEDDSTETESPLKEGTPGAAVTPISIFNPTTPVSESSPGTPKSADEPLSGAPTPERLAEKRRREEEDDDELGKLSKNKRKSPTGGGAGGFGQGVLNRKRSFGGSGSPPSKKIAINLAVKTTATASATAAAAEGEGGEVGKKEV